MNNVTLKSYQTYLNKLEAEREILKSEFASKKSQYDKKGNEIRELQKKIKKLQGIDLQVSEHAILRFIERAMGFDLELIKKTILSEELKEAHKRLGNGNYPIQENLKAVIKNNVVITIKK